MSSVSYDNIRGIDDSIECRIIDMNVFSWFMNSLFE